MLRSLALIIYYSLLRWLPNNNSLGPIGKFCGWLRLVACRCIFRRSGKHFVVHRGAYFGNGAGIEFGDYSELGTNCHIQGFNIKFGNYVMMAPDVLFLGGGHRTDDLNTPIGQQGNLEKSTLVIHDDVWIGQRAIIMGKTQSIGHGVIIAAGAVVTKPVPDFAVVAGNPAKVVKYRNAK